MKQHYTKVPLFLLLFTVLIYLPPKVFSQCTCSGGLPATPITYSVTIAPTNASVLTFTFPQFDPSIGTLSCVRARDTISGVTTTGALNTGPDSTAFLFQLTLNNKITGPGITINQVVNKLYGYDTLAPFGMPGDTITYGPDPVFTNAPGTAQTGGNAAYIGLGTVDFTYKVNGGVIALDGGLNYNSSISTDIGGTIALTYYYCAASALANGIINFSAYRMGNVVTLKWTGENEQSADNYFIEISRDGTHFYTTSSLPANAADSSGAPTYQYQYKTGSADGERLYFRIRKTDASGKSSFSPVKTIVLAGSAVADFRVYPNPASKHISLESPELLNGNIQVAITNSVGQQVYTRAFQLNGTNTISFDLPNTFTKGVYYLQVKNAAKNTQQLIKLFVREQ